MKLIFILFFAIVSLKSYSQEKPQVQTPSSVLILYPEVYQIITLERTSDFHLYQLQMICEEHQLDLITDDEEWSIFVQHPNYKIYEKSKETILENLNTIFKNTVSIKNTQCYGREYLPSAYLKYIIPSNLNAKHHPTPF